MADDDESSSSSDNENLLRDPESPRSFNGPDASRFQWPPGPSEVVERNAKMEVVLQLPEKHFKDVPENATDILADVKWPREVGVGFKVENVLKVDTLNQTFTAVFKMSLEWELTDIEYKLWLDTSWRGTHGRPPWEPLLDLPSAHKIEMRQELPIPYATGGQVFDIFEHNDRHYTVVYLRYRCVFGECYELQNFPFDCQDLTFVLQSLDRQKAVLRPRFKRKDFAVINTETFTIAEWELHPPVANFTVNASGDQSRSGLKKSEFIFQVKLKRRHHFYVHRIVILAGSLTCSSMLSWCIDLDRPHRLMLCFTILLTLVAFQLATANKLPQVRYFTLLDVYLVACQRFMMLVALQHGVLAKWLKEAWIDDMCGVITVFLYVVMQAIWIMVAIRQSKLEEQKLGLNFEELSHWLAARRQAANSPNLDNFKLNSRVYTEDQYGLMTFTHCPTEQRTSHSSHHSSDQAGQVARSEDQ
mmetsp:Transcript_17755/g.41174  ORF Transcript_17755/g.41174 Transcript_17755/m.41174 type:complete len:472 (-) Transcript_17755:52-1467(-)